MVDSVLGRASCGRRGDISRASKGGVAIATSTLEAACSPPLTPLRLHFTCRSMISCLPARVRGIRRSCLTVRRSPLRLCRCCWAAQRSAVPRAGGLPPRAPVPLSAQAVGLQQARQTPWPTDRGMHHPSRANLAVVLRQPAVAGHDTGPVRTVARDDPAFAAGRPRRLRLLRLAFPPFLGLSAVPAVRRRRHADPL